MLAALGWTQAMVAIMSQHEEVPDTQDAIWQAKMKGQPSGEVNIPLSLICSSQGHSGSFTQRNSWDRESSKTAGEGPQETYISPGMNSATHRQVSDFQQDGSHCHCHGSRFVDVCMPGKGVILGCFLPQGDYSVWKVRPRNFSDVRPSNTCHSFTHRSLLKSRYAPSPRGTTTKGQKELEYSKII